MKQYIFTQNASYSSMINGVLTLIKTFKKGDIIMAYGPFYSTDGSSYTVSYPLPVGSFMPNLRISNFFIKPYSKNLSLKSAPIESSYFGGMQSEESQENLKSAFAVIGIAAYILIFYFLFTGYPKD